MKDVEIAAIGPKSPQMDSVFQIHRSAKATLGPMTYQAFREQADKGCLLIAVDEREELVGYALYDIPRREIRLTHLCVAEGHGGRGIARSLVEAIRERHPDRNGIRARCRRSWPANKMWPHLDFSPLNEAPGRSVAGYPLTTWWLDFGQPTLFSRLPGESEERTVAALDTDVFLDLFDEQRQGSTESQGLLAPWISDYAELVVTKQVSMDLNNSEDSKVRKQQLTRCGSFRQAGESTASWRNSAGLIADALDMAPTGDHGLSDLNHLARAHASGVQFLITRDRQLTKRLGKVAHGLGVQITSPGEFIATLWASREGAYAPALLQNTIFRMEPLSGVELGPLCSHFLDQRSNERSKDLAKRIRDLLSDAENTDGRFVRPTDGMPVALMVRHKGQTAIEVPVIRLVGEHKSTIGRHVVSLQLAFARDNGYRVVKVTDPCLSPSVKSALKDEGFHEVSGAWWAVTVPILAEGNQLADTLDAIEGVPDSLALTKASTRLRDEPVPAIIIDELERNFWPMKVRRSDLPTFLVPIRPAFAMQLFDRELSQDTMFPQSPLGIFREQVYYRSPHPTGGIEAPARLLWYVTRKKDIAGSGMIRACSYLSEVSVDRPRTLYRRNAQLGVYGQTDVEAVAKNGRAMALRFEMTQTFPLPISLPTARIIAGQCGRDNLQLQSPWRIPPELFDSIYERGIDGSE